MADVFKLIGGLPSERKEKVYNLAGKTQEEAMKYLRYLYRNALFGTHTGLPPQIKNSKMNESLVSNIGDYSVIDVYAKQLTKCVIGTVVNFSLDDTVNPLGETYVYPCTDKNKPMGYMISDATPDTLGVCLVHGVLEVPVYYFGEEGEKKNYVEYDLENKCFKFSDSGYPVFNVYQDVDGDWIAIILFGTDNPEYVYDGSFATSISGITGSTLYVDVAEGDVVFQGSRTTCYDDLMQDVALSTGESLWLCVPIDAGTFSYLVQSTSASIPVSGSTHFYRIAENVDGKLKQIQYGDIFNDIQHIQVESVSGSTANIRLTGYTSSNLAEDHLRLRGVGCNFTTTGQNDIAIVIEGSTGGGGETYQDLYSAIKGGTPAICLTGSTHYVNIVGGTNTYTEIGADGEIIVGSTFSYTPYSYTGSFAAVTRDVTDSLGNVIHYVDIVDTKPRDHYGDYAGFVHLGSEKYSVNNYTTSFVDGDVIYLVGTFSSSSSNNLSLAFQKIHPVSMDDYFPTINDNQFCVRICYAENGKMIQAQYGDIVQPARYVGDGTTAQVIGNTISCIGGSGGETQHLYSSDKTISGGTISSPAVCLTGSTEYVNIVGGTNTYVSIGEHGEIIVGSTYSFAPIYQDLTSTVTGGTATIEITGSSSTVKFVGDGVSITGTTNGEIKLGVSGGTGGSGEYQVILSGGTSATKLQENNKYVVWIKDVQADIPELSIEQLQAKYSTQGLDCSSVDTFTNVILELPEVDDLNYFCFIDIDNQLHACNVTVIDTEKVGIAGGDRDLNSAIFKENNQVYIDDGVYRGNALCLDAYRYRLMYDPSGLVAKVQGGTISGSAKWFVWRIS